MKMIMKTKKKQLLKTRILSIIFLMTIMGFVIGCTETSDPDLNPETEPGNGYVVLKLTDAPFPADQVAEANISVDWIQMLRYDGEYEQEGQEIHETDSTHILFELEDTVTFNLINLKNGQTAVLGEQEVPVGNYDEIRLHVVDAGIVLTNGTEYDLKVPGGDASGLKIKLDPYLSVDDGSYAEVLLDFDVSRSFVVRGNLSKGKVNGFIFKPVVRAVPNYQATTGEIEGIVSDTSDVLPENARLTLLSGEDTVITAITNEEGFYAMIGILPGDYTLVSDMDDYVEQQEEVTVEKGEITVQDFVLVPEDDEEENVDE
jgi:hypothetical protein